VRNSRSSCAQIRRCVRPGQVRKRKNKKKARPTSPGTAPDRIVARLVSKLRQSASRPGLAQALEVGEIVSQALYGGDPRRCKRRGRHEPMFCKLARADGLPFSALTLSRFLDVYELYDRIGGGRFRFAGLSHYYAVLQLPRRKQAMALVAACGKRWPATRLEALVRRSRRERG
jgi:hypothetical protein